MRPIGRFSFVRTESCLGWTEAHEQRSESRFSSAMKTLEIYSLEESRELLLPMVGTVAAGFPSPADDYTDIPLDLNRLLIRNPDHTFLVKVTAYDMTGDHINYGDMLLVDCSLAPQAGNLVVCLFDGDYVLRVIRRDTPNSCLWLHSLNSGEPPTQVTKEIGLYAWGVVTYVVKRM